MIKLCQWLLIKTSEKLEAWFDNWLPFPSLLTLPLLLGVGIWFFSSILVLRSLVRIKRVIRLLFMFPYTRRMYLLREVCATCKHKKYQHDFPYNMVPNASHCGVGAFRSELLQFHDECWCQKFQEIEPLDLCDEVHKKEL